MAVLVHPKERHICTQNIRGGQKCFMSCGTQAIVQTLELLFEPLNAALLQPIIPKQNFPDSFFYHFPPKTPNGNVSQGLQSR